MPRTAEPSGHIGNLEFGTDVTGPVTQRCVACGWPCPDERLECDQCRDARLEAEQEEQRPTDPAELAAWLDERAGDGVDDGYDPPVDDGDGPSW